MKIQANMYYNSLYYNFFFHLFMVAKYVILALRVHVKLSFVC